MNEGIENHGKKVDDCLELLSKVGDFYKKKGVLVKQRIVSSMFPEKLIFENNNYRTPTKHEVPSKLCTDNKALGGNKKGKDCNFHSPSLGVDFTDKISNQLLKDIETLSSLKRYISSH